MDMELKTPMVDLCKSCQHWDTTTGWHDGKGVNKECSDCVNGPYTYDNFKAKQEVCCECESR